MAATGRCALAAATWTLRAAKWTHFAILIGGSKSAFKYTPGRDATRSRNMHPVALAALAWAFLPGPPTVPGSASRLLARVRPLSALDEADPFELELERQSEVVEVLRRVSDVALSDLESAKKSDDIVSLGLLRDLQTGEGSVRLEFVVPQDAAATGAVERLRGKCEAMLQAELPWVRAVQADARVVSDSAPTQLSPDGTLGAAGGGEEAPGVAAVSICFFVVA